jgi:hypothetical protein
MPKCTRAEATVAPAVLPERPPPVRQRSPHRHGATGAAVYFLYFFHGSPRSGNAGSVLQTRVRFD